MSQEEHHHDTGDPPPARGSSRREFTKRLLGGLAIAVPSLQALANAPIASGTALAECDRMYLVHQGISCARFDYCPPGTTHNCISIYYALDVNTGRYCRTVFENLGRCDGA